MNSSNFRFVLDLHSTQSQISIPVTLGDTARVWYISLSDGGLPYIIEGGCIAMVEIKRPTGTYIQTPCAIEKNTTVVYDFAMNEYTAVVEGIHDCSVVLIDTYGRVIGAPRFSMVVSDRVIRSDDINISDEDRNAIDGMMAAEASRQLAEAGRVNAEAARVLAEAGRVDAEIARESAVEAAIKRLDTTIIGADLSKYYTKKETDNKISAEIAAAVTVTLNTEV
jgi:hypothetical protein